MSLIVFASALSCGGAESAGPVTPPLPAPVSAVEIQPATVSMQPGAFKLLTAIPRDAAGNPLTGRSVTWSTSNSAIASVSAGSVSGLAEGIVTITASSEGKDGIATVEVRKFIEPVFNVRISPATIAVGLGMPYALTATIRDVNNTILTDRAIEWSTSSSSVATVGTSGVVTPLSLGTVKISATSEGKAGESLITVVAPASVGRIESLRVGYETMCAVNVGAVAFCWGEGGEGQLGNGTQIASAQPSAVAGNLSFSSVSPARSDGCGLTLEGLAYCWGSNDKGAVGDNTNLPRLTPAPISGETTFKSIGTGYRYGCGLSQSGAAYCWGFNQFGQVGDGTKSDAFAPAAVGGNHAYRSMVVGYWHACGLATDGGAFCWGDNREGELGDGTKTNASTPVSVQTSLVFSSLSAGESSTCGLTIAGVAYCWGFNFAGELGDGTTTNQSRPVPVVGGHVFRTLAMGNANTCGLTADNDAWCWGENTYGALGDGTNISSSVPVSVTGGHKFTSISLGLRVTCGLTIDKVAYCWGTNVAFGSSNVPLKVGGQP